METAVRSTSMGTHLPAAFQKRGDFGGDCAVGHQRGFQLIQFRLLGQTAVPQQVDDFLKRRVFGQRMDVDSPDSLRCPRRHRCNKSSIQRRQCLPDPHL